MTVIEDLNTIQHKIREYEAQYKRKLNSVALLGACKGQPAEKIVEAFNGGLTRFGESYLQEALDKIEFIPPEIFSNIEYHFIGHIQRNKTRKIAEHFSWVHSVDSLIIAQRLSKQRPETLPPLNICIEVNISHEASKAGVTVDKLQKLAECCAILPKIKLRGLMAIPEPESSVEQQRESFRHLRKLQQNIVKQGIPLDTLSMGMSEDYEAAIAEGSTMVRIGTALFGPRA